MLQFAGYARETPRKSGPPLRAYAGVVPETEAHTQNTFFLWAQSIEHLVDLLPQVTIDHRFQRRGRFFIFDERP